MIILFLGYTVNENSVEGLSGISIAGNKMQLNVLKTLATYEDVDLQIITIYPIAGYPRDKNLYIKKEEIAISENLHATRIGFLNIPIIKQVWQVFSVYSQVNKMMKNNKDAVILSFNLFPQVGLPLIWLKNKYGCETISLLADLPIDDKVDRKGISVQFRKLFDWLTISAIKKCDSFIVLNKHAAEKYALGKKYIVVEGGVDLKEYDVTNDITETSMKNIVYSGALSEYSGIKNLVDMMEYLKQTDIELHIYGTGFLQDYIRERSAINEKIKYFGRVSNDEMKKIQSEAWLLANPRPTYDKIAQVTFPSKMFEYMMSGTPVISTRLNGLSNEYLENLIIFDGETPKEMAITIKRVLLESETYLSRKAESARQFISENKNWNIQGNRIKKFLDSIVQERDLNDN